MAPFSWGDDFVRWQRMVTVACGITLVWLLGRLGTRLGGRRVGVVTAAIAAVAPTLWMNDGLVMSESVSMLLPWVVFNLARFEKPVLLTTNDGTTWLGANCADSYRGATKGGWTVLCVVADPDYSPDEEPSVRSARQRSLAVQYVRDHLGEVTGVVVARVSFWLLAVTAFAPAPNRRWCCWPPSPSAEVCAATVTSREAQRNWS